MEKTRYIYQQKCSTHENRQIYFSFYRHFFFSTIKINTKSKKKIQNKKTKKSNDQIVRPYLQIEKRFNETFFSNHNMAAYLLISGKNLF